MGEELYKPCFRSDPFLRDYLLLTLCVVSLACMYFCRIRYAYLDDYTEVSALGPKATLFTLEFCCLLDFYSFTHLFEVFRRINSILVI